MRQSPSSVGHLSDCAAADRIVGYLRSKHPVKTADNVAADTGLSVASIEKWLARGSLPSAPAMLALVGAYGPEFLAVAMHSPPAWLKRAEQDARMERLRANIAKQEAELAALAALSSMTSFA